MGLFPEWTWIMGFICGAFIGSFLNVVIYRTPRNMPLGKPKHSFCPKCKTQLRMPDLWPLFSWAIAGGRCRHCGEKVTSRYFWVELLNGSLWAWIWWDNFCVGNDVLRAAIYAVAASTLLAIVFIDWELYIIPDQINGFLFLVGIAYNVGLYIMHNPKATTWGIPSSIAGALTGIGIIWGIALFGRLLFGKDAMGHGDIKMARGFGAVLFPMGTVLSCGMAVAVGAILGILQVILLKSKNRPGAAEGDGEPEPAEPEVYEEPESIGSLLKSGLGYVLCFDLIGLAIPKFYKSWFGEDAILPFEEVEEWNPDYTMIPFGPYLA
ncbi:MAG: prepilin peptidase, partial [Armatimonadetes bacterium]|nr:prepilin peptidase [Armatimonadota bacterium]